MHDTLDERLARLGGSLEDAAGVRPATAVRRRGEQIRVAHRRRVMAATASSAAVVIVGVGSLVALGPGGGHRHNTVGPGPGGSATSTSAQHTAAQQRTPPGATTATASANATVVVDLKQDIMTVRDKDGQVVKTFPVSGGSPTRPTQPGNYTVTDKKPQMTLSSATAGMTPSASDAYDHKVDWVIELDGGGPKLYAAPWQDGKFGKVNSTHGDIGLSTDSAQWLYNHIAVGDRVQIQ